jgi:plastocyanin
VGRKAAVIGLVCVACSGATIASTPDATTPDASEDAVSPPVVDAGASDVTSEDGSRDVTIDEAAAPLVTTDCTGAPWGATFEVTDHMAYVPNAGNATIAAGATVTWAYADDGIAHSITSAGVFDHALASHHGARVCLRFHTPGEYPYHCKHHPQAEHAKIVVR